MKAVVVGLGRLGAPMAAVLASVGVEVTGVDVVRRNVDELNAGRAPVVEPGLEELIVNGTHRLRATSDYNEAVVGAQISFIVVPTPSGPDRMFSLEYVLAAVKEIGFALNRRGGDRHVVVVTSTVMPGSTVGPIRQALEAASGLVVGESVGLCYSPEFIALGSVIADLTRPDMILIGESDSAAGDVLAAVLEKVSGGGRPVVRMDPTSAEVAKLAVNTFVTTKISYANMLAELCERLPGANADLVTAAIGLDSRIGSKYLKPGAPFGGPCFPRDNSALAAFARSVGVRADIAEATDVINRRQASRVLALVSNLEPRPKRLAVLGLSYKPGTPVRDEAFGVELAAQAVAADLQVTAWDPMCRIGALPSQLSQVSITDSLSEALEASEVVVIATPWPELAGLGPILETGGLNRVVIDCWRVLEGFKADNVRLVSLGRGPEPEATIARVTS